MKLIRFYLKRLKPELRRLIPAAILVLPDVWLSLQLPYLMSIAVGTALNTGNLSDVQTPVLRMLIFSFGSAVLGYCGSVLIARAAQRFGNQLRNELFSSVMELPFTALSKLETGVLITRMVSDTQVTSRFLAFLIQSVWRPLIVLAFCLTQIARLGSNAYMWASVIAVLLCVMYFVMSRLSPWFTEIQIHIEKVNTLLKKTLGALRSVKAWNREPWEKGRFAEDNNRLFDLNIRIQSFMAVVNPLLMLLVNFAVMLVLLTQSRNAGHGTTSIENVMALIIYIQQMMMCVISLGQIFEMTTRTAVSVQRLDEMFDLGEGEGMRSGSRTVPEADASLQLDGLSFSYASDSPQILRDITVHFPAGSSTCLIGSTSAGKTTLCLLLARFMEPSAGTILFNGVDLAEYDPHALRQKLVLVPQSTELAPASIADNIAYGLKGLSRDDIVQAAKIACADTFISQMQHGYDEMVTQEGSSLSGGQKQCIAIARALVRRPSVLILDDCCTAMDVTTERRLRKSLAEHCPHMTVISVSQRLCCTDLFDRMMVLSGGRISATGNHEQLMEQSELYKNLYLSQSGEVLS